jgi:hypothetical protein
VQPQSRRLDFKRNALSKEGRVEVIHLIFYTKITQWGHGFCGTISNSLGMKVVKTYRKNYILCWDVYIICNVLINIVLMSFPTSNIQIEHVRQWSYISDINLKSQNWNSIGYQICLIYHTCLTQVVNDYMNEVWFFLRHTRLPRYITHHTRLNFKIRQNKHNR